MKVETRIDLRIVGCDERIEASNLASEGPKSVLKGKGSR
jgi:hypothetical protein